MTKAKLGKKMGVGMIAGIAALLLLGACTRGVPTETVAEKDREISSLQGQLATKDGEISTLRRQLATVGQDAQFWSQLTSLLMPVELPSMTDHQAYMLPSGAILALHFDNMDLKQARNLNWVALGIPGKFCQQGQEAIENQFGKGFTHFHDLMNDTHGGRPGAEGVWFVHVAVREFTAPWGRTGPGVDEKFMPTPAPVCP